MTTRDQSDQEQLDGSMSELPGSAEQVIDEAVRYGYWDQQPVEAAIAELGPEHVRSRIAACLDGLTDKRAWFMAETVAELLRLVGPGELLDRLAAVLAAADTPVGQRTSVWRALTLFDAELGLVRLERLQARKRTELLEDLLASTVWFDGDRARPELANQLAALELDRRESLLELIDSTRRGQQIPALALYEPILCEPELAHVHSWVLDRVCEEGGPLTSLRLEHVATKIDDARASEAISMAAERARERVLHPVDGIVKASIERPTGLYPGYVVCVGHEGRDGHRARATYGIDAIAHGARLTVPPYEAEPDPDEEPTRPESTPIAPVEAHALIRAVFGSVIHECDSPNELASVLWIDRLHDPTIVLPLGPISEKVLAMASAWFFGDYDGELTIDPMATFVSLRLWERWLRCEREPDVEWDTIARPRLRDCMGVLGSFARGRDLAALDLAATIRAKLQLLALGQDDLAELGEPTLDRAAVTLGRVASEQLVGREHINVLGLSDRFSAALEAMADFTCERIHQIGWIVAIGVLSFVARTCAKCHVRCLSAPDADVRDHYTRDEHPSSWRSPEPN